MSALTSIEWTDATWNPVRGCSRVSEGCRNCYAERVAARFSREGLPFHGFAKDRYLDHDSGGGSKPRWTGRVELVESHLELPLHWRKPRRIFVNSMSDLFHESLPDEAIDRVFAVMALAPQHTFQVLTKRPRRMLDYMTERRFGDWSTRDKVAMRAAEIDNDAAPTQPEWPLPNVWLGVSVEDQATADARIPLLLKTPAAHWFVSYEPAIGPVDFAEWLGDSDDFRGRSTRSNRKGRAGDRQRGEDLESRCAPLGPMDGSDSDDSMRAAESGERDGTRVSPSACDGGQEAVPRDGAPSCVPPLQWGDRGRPDRESRERRAIGQQAGESHAGNGIGAEAPCDSRSRMQAGVELPSLSWVIVGGESGPGARPFDVAWARSVVKQCRAARVPCFVKQLGARPFAVEGSYDARCWGADGATAFMADDGGVHFKSRKGSDPSEWPADLRVREVPA